MRIYLRRNLKNFQQVFKWVPQIFFFFIIFEMVCYDPSQFSMVKERKSVFPHQDL
jgi:hypothetical protein